jgi:hypothetical protein
MWSKLKLILQCVIYLLFIFICLNVRVIFYWFTRFADVFKTGIWSNLDNFTVNGELDYLKQQMSTFCLASRSANIVRQYKYTFNSFCKWCLSHKITQTLPSLDIYVSMYLIHLTNIGKSVSTINVAYYSISWAHRLAGVKDPCKSDLVITVKEGAHRSIGHLTVKNNR